MRILVADDSATIQKVFELAFENEDIEVVIASDGAEAMDMATRLSPSMIIADVNMPEMDGFELCRALKSNSSTSSIPVYLMSSALDEFDETRYLETGAAGRFEKPFRSEEMVSKVKAVTSSLMMEKTSGEEVEEDTFEDVDVSLDSLMESVDEFAETEPMAGLGVIGEGADVRDDVTAPVEPEEEDEPAGTDILELDPETMIDEQTGETDDEEDDLAVEIISGQAGGLDEDDLGDDEIASEQEVLLDNDYSDALSVDTGHDNEGVTRDTVYIEERDDLDNVDADSLSEESRRMLQDIDEELDYSTVGTEIDAETQDYEVAETTNTGVESVDDANDTQGFTTDEKHLEDSLRITELEDLINKAILELISDEKIERIIEKVAGDVMEDLKPKFLAEFSKVAKEATLGVAEDLVKKTIEQIKSL